MIVGPNWIFTHLPKTGGSFTRRFLLENFSKAVVSGPGDRLFPICHYPLVLIRDKLVFGFIRNPFAWYVSWWAGMLNKSIPFDKFINSSNWSISPVVWRKSLSVLLKDKDIGYMTLRYITMFCDYAGIEDGYYSGWKNSIIPPRLMDIIIPMEMGIHKGLQWLFKNQLGGLNDEQLVALNNLSVENKSEHKPWQEYFTDDLMSVVRERDKLIFEMHPYYKS